jgi:hypothetical protein
VYKDREHSNIALITTKCKNGSIASFTSFIEKKNPLYYSGVAMWVAPKLRLSNQVKERFKRIYELRASIPVVELTGRSAKVVQLKAR